MKEEVGRATRLMARSGKPKERHLAPSIARANFIKLVHHRELYPVDAPIVRPNRDTLYSFSNYSQVRLRLTAFGIAVRERSYINSLIAGGGGSPRRTCLRLGDFPVEREDTGNSR
jgi:hypothetical protein